jgi:hypothetical protein
MKNNITYQWFGAIIALLIFIIPVLMADELSLLASWLLIFFCWLFIIAIFAFKATPSTNSTNKQQGQ